LKQVNTVWLSKYLQFTLISDLKEHFRENASIKMTSKNRFTKNFRSQKTFFEHNIVLVYFFTFSDIFLHI
jgi:hypothetical protein